MLLFLSLFCLLPTPSYLLVTPTHPRFRLLNCLLHHGRSSFVISYYSVPLLMVADIWWKLLSISLWNDNILPQPNYYWPISSRFRYPPRSILLESILQWESQPGGCQFPFLTPFDPPHHSLPPPTTFHPFEEVALPFQGINNRQHAFG